MAKDPAITPPEPPDQPVPEEPQNPVEPAAEESQPLTRSEVINEFGEELGQKLIDAGLASFSSMIGMKPETFTDLGFSEEEIQRISEVVNLGGQDQGEPEIEETDAGAEETDAPAEEAESEAQAEEEEESEEEPVPATMEFHEHVMPSALTFSEAKAKLEEMSYNDLRDLCNADNLIPSRRKDETIMILLGHWYPPEPNPPKEELPEMSVRIKRIRGLL